MPTLVRIPTIITQENTVLDMLSYTFMQHALIAAVLVSVICGIIGTLVVVNRMVFIAGGIAHGAYGGIGIAFFLGLSPLLGAGVFAIMLALIVAAITLRHKERIDSVIGALWAFGMAIGIVFTDLTPGYNVDLMSYLFGSILSVPQTDLWFMGGIVLLVCGTVGFFYKELQAMSFDSEFAQLRGVPVRALYYLLIVLIALCVVATIRVVGLVLVIALLTIPPYIAEKVCTRLGGMMALSALIATLFSLSGLWLSAQFNLTSGAAIILVAAFSFFVSLGFSNAKT
jgi:zinc transport system permease protein